MSEEEHRVWLRATLATVQTDLAVIKSQFETIQITLTDHEQRIRQLEADVSNNRLVARIATTMAVLVGGGALGVMGSLVKSALGV